MLLAVPSMEGDSVIALSVALFCDGDSRVVLLAVFVVNGWFFFGVYQFRDIFACSIVLAARWNICHVDHLLTDCFRFALL
jgi:hypothetical protein